MSQIERPRFSCVLGGALATLTSLPRVAPIVHASAGCGGNLFTAAYSGSGYLGVGYCGGQGLPSSNIGESDVVFGGTERLSEQIRTTLEVIDADLFVVTSSCMTDIIADDIGGAVQEFKENQKPVIAIETGGFKGNSYHGYELVIEGLFKDYIKNVETKDKKLINIFGVIPAYDPFFRGDLEEIKSILERLGLKVNTFFTNDQTIENVKSAGEAALNISFSQIYGREVLESIEKTHKIPYMVADLPIGAIATREFLYELSKKIKINKKILEQVLTEKFSIYYKYIDRALDLYADSDFQQYAIVVANANGAIPYTKFLAEELGWIPKYVYITDDLKENQKQILVNHFNSLDIITKPELIFETDTSKIGERFLKSRPQFLSDRYVDQFSPAYILGSTLEKDFANSINAKLLSVSFPITNRLIIDRGYAGFRGGLHLFEDIINILVGGR